MSRERTLTWKNTARTDRETGALPHTHTHTHTHTSKELGWSSFAFPFRRTAGENTLKSTSTQGLAANTIALQTLTHTHNEKVGLLHLAIISPFIYHLWIQFIYLHIFSGRSQLFKIT